MQKKILLFVVCITLTGVAVHAQHKKDLLPPPPPPPAPPIEMVAEIAPPPPPIPPAPPEPPVPSEDRIIVNSNGYDISVETPKGIAIVVVEKNGVKQKIKLSTWNANRKYYEKKYGLLPPPPPPPPVPVEEEVREIRVIPDTQ